jgi:glucose/mannose transport system permease protein
MSAHSRLLLDKWLPQLAVSPALVVSLVFFYGLTIWVGAVSFTDSEGVVTWNWVGWDQYVRLFYDDSWWRSLWNLAKYLPLVVGLPFVLGCLLAMLLDQKVRFENGIRTAVLYPLALSWIVAGTIWRWLLTPDTGIEKWLISVGFEGAVFDWIVQPRMSIYALVIVAVWASTGFVMSMFIAGLRSIEDSVIKAAMIDGASKPRIYLRVLLPTLRPTIFSAALILLPAALRTFDLVVVLTQGGPGQSSVLPAFYVFDRFFRRD